MTFSIHHYCCHDEIHQWTDNYKVHGGRVGANQTRKKINIKLKKKKKEIVGDHYMYLIDSGPQ